MSAPITALTLLCSLDRRRCGFPRNLRRWNLRKLCKITQIKCCFHALLFKNPHVCKHYAFFVCKHCSLTMLTHLDAARSTVLKKCTLPIGELHTQSNIDSHQRNASPDLSRAEPHSSATKSLAACLALCPSQPEYSHTLARPRHLSIVLRPDSNLQAAQIFSRITARLPI